MKRSNFRVTSELGWYFLWSAMFVLAAVKALVTRPVISGNWDFSLAAVFGLCSAIELLLGSKFLPRKQRILSAVFLLFFCNAQLVQFALSIRSPSPYQGVDFSAYYLAGKVLSEKPVTQSIYELPRFADGRMNLNGEAPASSTWYQDAVQYRVPFSAPYIYPPLVAISMKPLVRLSFAHAYRVWTGLTIFFVAASLHLLLKLFGLLLNGRLMLVRGGGLFSFSAVLENLFFGQVGGVILFLLTVGVYALARRRMWLSALCYALATLIKLTPVLAVPLLVFYRQWKWLIAYGVSLASLMVFSAWQAGWTTQKQFLKEVLPSISGGAPGFPNLSIVALVQQWFAFPVPFGNSSPLEVGAYAAFVARLLSMAVYLLMIVRCYLRRRESDVVRELVAMGLLAIVVSPIAWTHHFTTALLPFFYIWCAATRKIEALLVALVIAVGTNFLPILRIYLPGHLAQTILSAVVPVLTVAVAYAAVAHPRDRAIKSKPLQAATPA